MLFIFELQARQDFRIQCRGIIGSLVLAVRRRWRTEQGPDHPNALRVALRCRACERGAAGCPECAQYRARNPEFLLQDRHVYATPSATLHPAGYGWQATI